jgi:c-di-GMP-binding flagellar brake protein YcgR
VATLAIGILAGLALLGGGVALFFSIAGKDPDDPTVSGRERRRAERIVPPKDKPAELQIMGADFLEIPRVKDISTGGIAISVPHRFRGATPTQEVDLLLTLHGQGTVKAKGAIRRVSSRHDTTTFGVELVAVTDEDRQRIERYVAEISRSKTNPDADS